MFCNRSTRIKYKYNLITNNKRGRAILTPTNVQNVTVNYGGGTRTGVRVTISEDLTTISSKFRKNSEPIVIVGASGWNNLIDSSYQLYMTASDATGAVGTHYYEMCGRYGENLPLDGGPYNYTGVTMQVASSLHGDYLQFQQNYLAAGDQDDGEFAFNLHLRGQAVQYQKTGQGYHRGRDGQTPTENNDNNVFYGNVTLCDNRCWRHPVSTNTKAIGNVFMNQVGSPAVGSQGGTINIASEATFDVSHNIIDYAGPDFSKTAPRIVGNVFLNMTDVLSIPPNPSDVAILQTWFMDPYVTGEFDVWNEERPIPRADHKLIWERYLQKSASPGLSSARGGTQANDRGLERCDYDNDTYTNPSS